MGIKLIVEVLDHAPPELTWREGYILLVLAETANDTTRECWPCYDGDTETSETSRKRVETFRKRVRCGRSQFYAALKSLTDHKVIEVTQRGQKHRAAHYRITPLRPAPDLDVWGDVDPESQGPGNPDTEPHGPETSDTEDPEVPFQGPENPDAENPDPEAQCPGSEVSVSGFRALSVRETRTPSPQSPQVPSSLGAEAPEDLDGALFPPPADDAAERPPAGRKKRPDPLEGFDAFWSVYPKKVGPAAARKAYAKAVKDGAEPAAILDGARLYALDCRMVENPHYIKHPSGWLNDGRWADERAPTPAAAPTGAPDAAPKPPWCRDCNEITRLVDKGDGPQRCPRCHPLIRTGSTS